jgi:hypothetical protein
VNLPNCEYEEQMLAALRAGDLPADLAAHADGCAVCQEVKLVFGFLSSASAQEVDVHASAAGLIWWRARLDEKRALAERSVAPILTVQKIALIVVVALAAILAAIAGPEWIGKASGPLVAVVTCACAMIVATAGALAIWARSPK